MYCQPHVVLVWISCKLSITHHCDCIKYLGHLLHYLTITNSEGTVVLSKLYLSSLTPTYVVFRQRVAFINIILNEMQSIFSLSKKIWKRK